MSRERKFGASGGVEEGPRVPSKLDACPICLNAYGGDSRRTGSQAPQNMIVYFECELCGRFGVSDELIRDRSTKRRPQQIDRRATFSADEVHVPPHIKRDDTRAA